MAGGAWLGQARLGGARHGRAGMAWTAKQRLTTRERKMSTTIQIDKIETETMRVPIIGTAPLIVHNFSQKAKQQMLDAQQGKKTVKQIRDPKAEYEAAFYRIADGESDSKYGFPATAFKSATVSAARFYGKSVSMRSLLQFLFMHGVLTDADTQQLVPITGEPRMREDVVRLGGAARSADLRYRPEFWPWSTTLTVTYVTSALARASVLSLIDAGGLGVGVGEWRPEKQGEFGTYEIDKSRQTEIVK